MSRLTRLFTTFIQFVELHLVLPQKQLYICHSTDLLILSIPYRAAASTAMAAPTRLPAEAKGAAAPELEDVVADFVDDPVVVCAEVPVGAAVVEPESVEAEEDPVVVEDESEDAVVDESEEAVVLVEEELSEAVADPVCEELSLHTTLSGVLTPAVEQICWANETAVSWSDLLQAPARQQAMPLRKSAFLQMQAMSSCWQPPIAEPVVNLRTQALYFSVDTQLVVFRYPLLFTDEVAGVRDGNKSINRLQ